jgi:D-proline reductase (dithiol) PrdB
MALPPVEYVRPAYERYIKLGYEPYRYFQPDTPTPWAPMTKPLSECRVGVVTTSGAYVKGQVAFYYKDDPSIRRLPKDTPVGDLRFSHVTEHFLPSARKDPNSVLPVEPLRRLEEEGVVASVADDILSCMGGLYSQRKAREIVAPAVAAEFVRQEVDVALLVPM